MQGILEKKHVILCDPILQKKVFVNKIEVVKEEDTDRNIVDLSKNLE